MEIRSNGSTLFYRKTGTGDKAVLLFHGFGQDHTALNTIAEALSFTHTCYSFDLFFHGLSHWAHGDRPIDQDEWSEMMKLFLKSEHIFHFDIIGYSIGARLALATLTAFPKKTERVVLIAPDGLVTNPWFRLATGPAPGRSIFRKVVQSNRIFPALTTAARKLRLITPTLQRFANLQMATRERRDQVYYTWMVLRNLQFGLDRLMELLHLSDAITTIYLGKDDHLINSARLRRMVRSLPRTNVVVVDASHHRLLRELSTTVPADLTKQNDNRR